MPPRPTGSALLQAYQPTLRNRLASAIMGDRRSSSLLGDIVERTIGPTVGMPSGPTLMDFTPLGLPFMADEAGRKMAQPGVKGKASGLFDMGLAMVPVPAAAKAVKGVAKAGAKVIDKKATQTLADFVAQKAEQKAAQGIKAYHGSPHAFDQFELSKIGTGEGAQAYGHGLYFAENEGVAKGYRDTLAAEQFLTPNGSVWSPDSLQHMNVRVVANRSGTDLDAPLRKAYELYQNAPPQTKPLLEQDIRTLEALKSSGGVKQNPGHMYEVNINANPEHFLDWDAPLSRQEIEQKFAAFPSVLEADAKQRDFLGPDKGFYGAHAYARAANWKTGVDLSPDAQAASAVSQTLAENGVPGIKYLDQGSRGAGEGTRNYVVFDPKTIEILRRYGIFLPAAGVGAAAATQAPTQQPQPQNRLREY